MNIVVAGYFGHRNLGDESILSSISGQLQDHDLTVVSLDTANTAVSHGLRAVDFFDLENLEKTVAACDVVIMATGGAYQEIPGIPYYDTKASQLLGNPYGHPNGNLTGFGIVPVLASFYHKALVFLAIGMGPFYSQQAKHFCSFLLSSASLITARDRYSLDWAKGLSPNSNIHLTADAAFLLQPKNDSRMNRLLTKYGLKSKQFIALSLRELLNRNRQHKTVRELAGSLSDFLAEHENLPILFIPFQNMISDYPVTDINMAQLLLQELDPKQRDKIVIWEDELNPQSTLNLIGNARFGIGMRYHFLLFCILNEIPVISISYDTKCINLMDDAGMSELSFDIPEVEAGPIASKMHTILDSYDNYTKIVCSAKKEFCTRASISFDLLEEFLGKLGVGSAEQHSIKVGSTEKSQLDLMPYRDLDISRLIDYLSQQTGTIQELHDGLKERIDSLREQNSVILKLSQENDQLKKTIQDLHDGLKERIDCLKERNSIILKLSQENDQLKQATKALQQETLSLKNRLDLVHGSITWKLGQLYGKVFSSSLLNIFTQNLFKKFLFPWNRGSTFAKGPRLTDESGSDEKLHGLAQLVRDRAQNDLFIITSTFPFDEFYNQRAINFSKYLAAQDFCVLYIAWRWSKSEEITGNCEEVYPNVFQVPVDYFIEHTDTIIDFSHSNKWLIVEFPHPDFYPIMLRMQSLGYRVLYDLIDDWKEFHKVDQASWFQEEFEKAILLKADAVTAVSPPLIQKFSGLRPDIMLVRNGFSQELLGTKYDGKIGSKSTGFTVGYFGHLTESWFDWDFISQIARARSDFSFEIIGYGESPLTREKISRFKNIHLIGKVHPSSLSQHVRNWDVAIIPFMDGLLSESVDPIKIYEYLYFGLPVVVKGISHLGNFPYVTVCQDSVEAQNAISEYARMKRRQDIQPEILDDFLKNCTWEERFKQAMAHIRTELP